MNYISFHTLNARTLSINILSTHLLYFLVCFTNFWPINKHVFVLEIDIQIPRHIFIIWCMRRRFSAVFINNIAQILYLSNFFELKRRVYIHLQYKSVSISYFTNIAVQNVSKTF